VSGALTRYRVMAYVTGVVLAFMTVVGLPYKYLFHQPHALWYSVGWIGHGWLYVIYLITTVDLATRVRWGFGRTVLVALAGTIPFMSFVAEHFVTKDVRARLAAVAAPPAV
jgi:integral membrane protein